MPKERGILKSWKEIASYLGVATRTAQRWKHERGLPVRQPGAMPRSAVLGVPDEIDQWLLAASETHAGRRAPEPEHEGVVATEVLWKRPSRPKQLEREVEALLELARLAARRDRKAVLTRIAGYALTLCKAESAGFSILETAEDGTEIFRWTATCGRMLSFEGGTTPANFSPCGYCLERNAPQLFEHPELFYSYLRPIAPIAELLLIPMHDDNAWLGTIWVICHQRRRKFDPEDARLMGELGSLAGAMFAKERPRQR